MGIPHAPKPLIELEAAGGAYVRRRFQMGPRERQIGETITPEELASIPRANLVALINTGRLELWPAAPEQMFVAERFAFCRFGKWVVVEGRLLTPEPVSKEEAQALVASGSN